MKNNDKLKKAMFAAGCFWGVEDIFMNVKGVKNTTVGYSGGHTENPTYKDVCGHTTGHAEVVLVEYDPKEVSYEKLLKVFFESHDPTTVNRQGPDVGSQYRSAIFFFTPEQESSAKRAKEEFQRSGKFKDPVVTEITPAGGFWRAEEYHQKYFQKTGLKTCH
jgi:peptide-methionine (S)-S-oxide reductase